MEALISKIQRCYEGPVVAQIIEELPAETSISTAVTKSIQETVAGTQTAFDKTKHAKQDAALVNRMIEANLLRYKNSNSGDDSGNANDNDGNCEENEVVFAEFGAGKGLLGLAVSCIEPRSMIKFIERNGLRWKADKPMGLLSRPFERIRMDIKHCSLEGL